MKAKINKVTISIIQGNLYTTQVDGIVHATDPNLSLDPALVDIAGPFIEEQTTRVAWCDVGSAIATDGGKLENVQKILHTVGPRWGEGAERGKLANATWSCLQLAEEQELSSIAMPAISVGALGYPLENCATTMLTKIVDFTFEPVKHLRTIILCLLNEQQLNVFRSEFERQLEALKEAGEGKVRA